MLEEYYLSCARNKHQILSISRRQLNFLFVQAVERIISGWSVGKIIITLSFGVDTSKNKNIDHGVKETCAIMSTQVTYETDLFFLLQNSTISSALNFCFLYIFYWNLKEKGQIKRNKNSKKNKCLYKEISIVIFWFAEN